MSSDSGVQFIGRRRKRPRREPSVSSNAQSSNTTPGPTHSSNMPPVRFPGDGFDYRRPVTSSAPPDDDSEVIDLTNEPDSPQLPRRQLPESNSRRPRARPPRFGRNIMTDFVDLAEEDDDPDPPSSPEVQFVSSTTRQPPPSQTQRPASLLASNFWSILPLPHTLFRPTNEGGYRRPWQTRTHFSPETDLWLGDGPGAEVMATPEVNWDLAVPPGFERQRERPRDTYKPPSPALEGFTRSATEDDVAICPNCDEELGKGDEVKQQIWISKQCGHVYCGECAVNRSMAKAKKNSSKTKPFSRCPVPGCGKHVSSPKSMFQVYL
ncbi:hypothetical protein BDW71DRAFT_182823 [Aspergillus fruticulosus]